MGIRLIKNDQVREIYLSSNGTPSMHAVTTFTRLNSLSFDLEIVLLTKLATWLLETGCQGAF